MKKALIVLVILMMAVPCYAQNRGALTNMFASWYTVETSATTITLPFKSRDLWIQNGSAVDLCVSPTGGTILDSCTTTDSKVFQLDAGKDFYATDFVTDSVSLKGLGAQVSPVSVVVTY